MTPIEQPRAATIDEEKFVMEKRLTEGQKSANAVANILDRGEVAVIEISDLTYRATNEFRNRVQRLAKKVCGHKVYTRINPMPSAKYRKDKGDFKIFFSEKPFNGKQNTNTKAAKKEESDLLG